MQISRHTPNLERISVLAATLLFAYALSRLIALPTRVLAAELPGIYLEVEINFQTLLSLFVAGLAATGTEWLISDHPQNRASLKIDHWMMPTLTAWVIGVPLFQRSLSAYWWIEWLLGGGLLILVFIAEYIVVDPQDALYPVASVSLIALAYALYFLLAVTMRAAQLRLFILIPALSLAIGLTTLRTLHLRLRGVWALIPSGILTLVMLQLTAALHYLPLQPIPFGLALLGPAYALALLIEGVVAKKPWYQVAIEPLLILGFVWVMAWWAQ